MNTQLVETLGVQSYCYRTYKTHAEVIKALKDTGMNRIELYGGHLNPTTTADYDDVLALYADEGVTISSFGVHGFTEDEASARKVFEFAVKVGFPAISADLRTEAALPVVEKLCEEYGKKVAIHNHGRKHRLGPVWALEDLFARASMNVGLCLDTAWMLDSGPDPVEIAKQFRDRLYGVHIKDFIFDRAGKPEDVIVGQGNLDLDALVAFLVETDYDGYLTLEYEGDVNDPVPATKECVEAVQASFAKLG